MNDYQCTCGFQADNADQLDDHFGALLIPDDDVAPDGQVHAEAAINGPSTEGALRPGKACTCGFTGTAPEIDAHILLAFAPTDDGIRSDGVGHVPAGNAPVPADGQGALTLV